MTWWQMALLASVLCYLAGAAIEIIERIKGLDGRIARIDLEIAQRLESMDAELASIRWMIQDAAPKPREIDPFE